MRKKIFHFSLYMSVIFHKDPGSESVFFISLSWFRIRVRQISTRIRDTAEHHEKRPMTLFIKILICLKCRRGAARPGQKVVWKKKHPVKIMQIRQTWPITRCKVRQKSLCPSPFYKCQPACSFWEKNASKFRNFGQINYLLSLKSLDKFSCN